jgi:tRNA (mo5U34)-methyltransferase
MREKRVKVGGFEIAVAMEDSRAERIRQNLLYQRLLRPTLDRLRGFSHVDKEHLSTEKLSPTVNDLGVAISPEAQAVKDRIAEIEWYHTHDLPHGVSTPGVVDHRNQLHLYGLPEDMSGLRALDVATYDGYWAFEMERRGADVVAIDVGSWAECDIPRHWLKEAIASGADKTTGEGFFLARELLGSKVERKILSVYDLSPEEVGKFDVVFLSDLLLHLRDPVRAMESIYTVTDGFTLFADVYNPELDRFPNATLVEFCMYADVWWRPSISSLKKMIATAGFSGVEQISTFVLNAPKVSYDIHKVVLKATP